MIALKEGKIMQSYVVYVKGENLKSKTELYRNDYTRRHHH